MKRTRETDLLEKPKPNPHGLPPAGNRQSAMAELPATATQRPAVAGERLHGGGANVNAQAPATGDWATVQGLIFIAAGVRGRVRWPDTGGRCR